nr:MAG TPA: hypothetical protein [Caudoviricetes sp.]
MTITKNSATLDEDIYLYRLDKNIELYFTIVNNKYKFDKSDLNNIIAQTQAAYFQVRLYKKDDIKYSFAIQPTDGGKAILKITDDLIDDPIEIGDYDFQISLLDADKTSMISMPIVSKQLHVCEPLISDQSITGVALLGLSKTVTGEIKNAFDENGNYVREIHNNGEVITAELFNKWEEALDSNTKAIKNQDIPHTISSKVLATVPASNVTLDEYITVNNVSINKDRRYYIEFLGNKKLCSLLVSEELGNCIICSIGGYTIQAFNDSTNILIYIGKINYETATDTFTDLVIYEEEVKYLDSKYLETNLVLQNSISLGRVGDIGMGSSAIGGGVTASGNGSHAEGSGTTASGESSHAEGSGTTASGESSHAEGEGTIASGSFSYAGGSGTTASGECSHAEGGGTTASGECSHVEGAYTIASSQNQHVQGKYNIEDTEGKYAHIVGNGTDEDTRSNAHTLDWQGNAWYAGKLSQEGTPTEDKDLVTKKYVDDSIPIRSFPVNDTTRTGAVVDVNNLTVSGRYVLPKRTDGKQWTNLMMRAMINDGSDKGKSLLLSGYQNYVFYVNIENKKIYCDNLRIVYSIGTTADTTYIRTEPYYLTTTNTKEYTPTNDYNPATKKYVDNIKTDINTIKTDLGTETLNTTAKDVKGAVNEVAAQYKDITNDVVLNTFDDCIYNRSALKNINNREFFSMVVLGDSIGAGTAATDNYGFIQRFTNASYYHQSFVKYTMEYLYYKEATGWTKEENGINLQTISSSNASKEFFGIPNFPWVLPTNDYKVAIVYCKKTDGGQFDVKDSDDKVLTTIDCSGENNLGCISNYFTVGAGKAFKICPKQDNKAYVIAAMIDHQPEKMGYKIVNWSVGGRQLCDYTKDEIKTMILYDSFDTVYCELFANDSAAGKFDEYFDKLTHLIDTAKNNKKDVILNITNRNESYDATEDAKANFKKWENKMYEIAKEKNCCLINFDKLIGGHTVGKANGLIADTIHPNDVGHEIMAKLINFVIFKDNNTYEVNKENTMYPIYGKRHISEEQYYNTTQYFNDIKIRVWDENGNKNGVAPVMPIIRHWVGTRGYTKFAEEGALGSTGRLLYINQNNINTQANWKMALTSPFLETVTTVPTVNDDNKNTIFRYRQEGKDDQIIVCVKANGTEQFKAIQLIDIV